MHRQDLRVSHVRWALPVLLAAAILADSSPTAAATELVFQPQLGVPADSVNIVGASPGELPAPGAVWATGDIGSVPATVGGQQIKDEEVLLRHGLGAGSEGTGWQIVPVVNGQGESLKFTKTPSVTTDGGIVLLSEDATKTQTIVTRDPGGAFVRAPTPPAAVLEPNEPLYPQAGSNSSPIFTSLDEAGHTGALIVPEPLPTSAPGVLHYDGTRWTRERICIEYTGATCVGAADELSVLAIAASSPQNAWLLASSESEPLILFKRTPVAGSEPVWVKSQPASWVPSVDKVSARSHGQMLTVTSQGVWVDALVTTPTAQNADISLLVEAASPSTLLGTWCYPQAACGQGSLGAPLPEGYRSFAWPEGGGLGTRIIAGLGDGALLRFQSGGDFQYVVGGGAGSSDVAFASPEEGWISGVAGPGGGNSAQVEHVTVDPTASSLQAWPLPFRRPLMAIAPQPGTTPGDPDAQALAVGDRGQIARYIPGEGWTPEFLYNGAGTVQPPRLRGVAWPEPGRAYAVGDEGAMWVWRSDTGLWEPDPAAPVGFHANLTSIAFSPVDPAVGYAVGKQGALLAYDKTWTQQAVPAGLQQANFTSVAFAGGQALATYRMVNAAGNAEVGGLIVNDGSGWRIDPSAQALLAELPDASESVLSKVAGLPDGGAVAAGPGVVIERDSPSSSWRFSRQPLPEAQNIAALAAIRAGPEVQALVSIDLNSLSNPNSSVGLILGIDFPPTSGFGQPATLIEPDPLPINGYLLRETATGWQDLEQRAYPSEPSNSNVNTDLPDWPDAVLALDVDPTGSQGWAVGGQTGGLVEKSSRAGAQLASQSAAAFRLGTGPAPPQSAGAPIPTPPGQATFAVGGNAQCAEPCADFANEGLGPDSWLSGAVSRAAQIPGLRAFLYTGARVAPEAGKALSTDAFTRELEGYRRDLQGAGALPVYAAASPSDIDHARGLTSFVSALGKDAPAGSVPPGSPTPPAGTAAYAFESGGGGETVYVIVLDYSGSALAPGELGWLAAQLDHAKQAGEPAIVMGNADLVKGTAPNYAADASAAGRVLLEHGASAYLFDSPGENRIEQIGSGAGAIPAFGTGTLGYVPPPPIAAEFFGASGFLLASVNFALRDPRTNRAPVTATLIPNISQLALDATDGTLLRRSQVALFQALARRPDGGLEQAGGITSAVIQPDPYVPIPEMCQGSNCAQFIAPSYTFSSSRPDIGNFVEQEPNATNPRAVLQGVGGKPIPDPQSGLFCAFNAGTTTVSITTGGLTYSEQVTVQAGSVEQPCGTVPLVNPPAASLSVAAPFGALPPNAPPASSPTPLSVAPPPPPVPLLPANPVAPTPPRAARLPPPFFVRPLAPVALVAVPLLPPPVLARPIPPSGTAPVAVFSPAVAPEEKQEDEEAVESARNSMAAYNADDHTLPPIPLIVLIAIAAGAGAGIRRAGRGRGSSRAPALARARVRRYDWLRSDRSI
jgi:hypothetical protein